jgi:hypothetical protein
MIIVKDSTYIVIDTNTKEVISRHPYVDEYTRKKAKAEAEASNEQWKLSAVTQ